LELDLKIPILSQLLIPISKELTVKGYAIHPAPYCSAAFTTDLTMYKLFSLCPDITNLHKKCNSTNMQPINT